MGLLSSVTELLVELVEVELPDDVLVFELLRLLDELEELELEELELPALLLELPLLLVPPPVDGGGGGGGDGGVYE